MGGWVNGVNRNTGERHTKQETHLVKLQHGSRPRRRHSGGVRGSGADGSTRFFLVSFLGGLFVEHPNRDLGEP